MSHQDRSITRYPGAEVVHDQVASESPLEIRVEGTSVAITMRTPGDDLDLAAGFLLTEGVIDGADDLVALAHIGDPAAPDPNTVDCRLAGGVEAHRAELERATRELYATSSCGICGKASIDRLQLRYPPLSRTLVVDPDVLLTLTDQVRARQQGHGATGGLHAAALFSPTGELTVLREDVGRHNAVDKVLGHRLRTDRVPVDDAILFTTSRAGFEIIQKARVAGVSAVAAMGAPTTLAVDLACDSGMALYGFVGPTRFNQYSG